MGNHVGTFSILDSSEETSTTKFNFGAITSLTLPGFLTEFGALRTAIGGIIKGVVSKEQWVGDKTDITSTPPSDMGAQIELKWLVRYEGATSHKKFRYEIPAADPAHLIAGTDKADMTATPVAAYVTAVEAIAKSPDDDTEGINVIDITLVGRNV